MTSLLDFRPSRQRKQRASNWTTDETVELLRLRFQTEDLFAGFLKQGNKDDEKNNWTAVAARLSSKRDWKSCRGRLKTLTAQYKKLVKEDTRTGNNTEDPISYPAYWEILLECLGPYSGLNGTAIADSERHLTTVCTRTAVGAAVEESAAESDSEDEDQGSYGVGHDYVIVTTVEGSSNRRSVFSPAKATPSKKSKKDSVLSTLASSMSTLVDHIVVKPSGQERTEATSVQTDFASMHEDIL